MLKRITALVMAALCLCSCSMGGSKVKITRSTREYETDYSSVKAEIIALCDLRDKEFEEQINDEIAQSIESAIIAFDTDASESADNVRMGNKCVFDTSWSEKYNDQNFLSIVEERYEYLGGAHGQTAWLPRNIDTAEYKEVTLADLFLDEGYVTTLNRMINELVEENNEEYADLWEKPEIRDVHQTDYYIENGNLVIFFQPYDLSYYARGFVEFPLPLSELSGYLKEEYRRLI